MNLAVMVVYVYYQITFNMADIIRPHLLWFSTMIPFSCPNHTYIHQWTRSSFMMKSWHGNWHFVRGIHQSKELWYLHEQAIEQTVDMLVIGVAKALMWHNCTVVLRIVCHFNAKNYRYILTHFYLNLCAQMAKGIEILFQGKLGHAFLIMLTSSLMPWCWPSL